MLASCDSLEKLETKVNLELKKMGNWLKLNKLTLNLQKNSYIFINKYFQLPIKTPLKIILNNNKITRVTSVKYLNLYFQDNLKFDIRIKKLDGSLPANPVNERSVANAVTLKRTFRLP